MPTFGKTTDGTASSTSNSERVFVSEAVPSSDGTVVTGHARFNLTPSAGNRPVKFAIYADDGGLPGALLAESDPITVTDTTTQWRTFTFSGDQQISITSGTSYWIGPAWDRPDGVGLQIWRNGTNTAPRYEQNWSYPTLPDPFGPAVDTNSGPIDAYVTYTEGPETETYRFYLPNQPARWKPNAASGFLNDNTQAANARQLLQEPFGAADDVTVTETSDLAPYWMLLGQWVSHPATAAGTIVPAHEAVIAFSETLAAADMNPVLTVYVLQGDTTISLGTAINRSYSAIEMPTTPEGIALIPTGTVGSEAPRNFEAGDHIVVEVIARAMNTGTTPYGATLYFGGTADPDLADGDTNLDRPAWIDLQITPGVTFVDPAVDGTAAADLGFTAAAAGTVVLDGQADADLGFAAAAAGTRIVDGEAAASLGFAAAAAGVPLVDGTAASDLGFTAAATGVPLVDGTAATSLGFAATAEGAHVVDGTVAANFGFSAAAAGTVLAPSSGTAEADLGFAAAAVGTVIDREFGTAEADLGFAATAVGTRTTFGTAAAPLGFAAHIDGQVRDLITGEADADLGFAASAAGRRIVDGTAACSLGFTAAATGETFIDATDGTALAALGFTAAAGGSVEQALGVPFLADELGDNARLSVQVAWGADPSGDPDVWTWTDITRHVRAEPGISTKMGRDDEASTSQPASCTMVLTNDGHDYSLGGHSPNWPYVRRNVPVRVRITTNGTTWRIAFIGQADGWTPGWDLTGRIPVVTLSASGVMRRILQGDAPITSAYRRAMTETQSVVAYWPFEDGRNASYAAPVRGGSNMVTASDSHEFDTASPFDCSAPLVRLRSSPDGTFEDFGASVAGYTVTGETQVRWLMSFPRESLPNGAFLTDIFLSGTLARVSITYADGTDGNPEFEDILPLDGLHITTWDQDNEVITENFNIGFPLLGATLRMSVEIEQVGDDVVLVVGTVAPGDSSGLFYTVNLSDRTVGRVESIFMGGNDVDDVILGHVTLQNELTSLWEASGPLSAHIGERVSAATSGRLDRLLNENHVPFRGFGSGALLAETDRMGPQLARPLMELLRECEAVDQGQLFDGVLSPGLLYTSRRYRELGNTEFTIDAATGELAEPFTPTDDDQRNRNRVEATVTTGVSATYEDVDGPLGTSKIGFYDSSVEANNQHDDMAVHYAAWHVALGTVEGYRFPSVTVDLRAAPHLAAGVLLTIPGDRIDVLNADQVFAGYLPGDVPLALIVEGISHEIGPRHWRATFRCSPFSPWGVARVADEAGDDSEYAWRLDTDGTRLVGDHSAGATSLVVSNEPFPIATDAFGRTVANAWGSADLGGAYDVAGTSGALASDFNVGSGVGTIAVNGRNRSQYAYLPGLSVEDVDIAVTCSGPTDITGGLVELADVMVRGIGFNDYYYARVTVTANQSIGISIVEVAAGQQSELVTSLVLSGVTFTGTVRCRMQAEGRTLRARVWDPSDPEPTEWQREVTVAAARPGWVGTRVAVATSNTNALPVVFSHDDFEVTTVYPPGGPLWTTDADDYPLRLSVGGIPVLATACSGASSPQTFTVEALPLDRTDGSPVALWDPRPLGL